MGRHQRPARHAAGEYAKVSGGLSVLVLRWVRGTDVQSLFRDLAKDTCVPGLVLAEPSASMIPCRRPSTGVSVDPGPR